MDKQNPRTGESAGVAKSIAADTSNPIKNHSGEQILPNIASNPSLAIHIRQYVPDADGAELEHRIALLKARDWNAAMRGRTDCSFASQLACDGHEVAGRFVFATGESEARLKVAASLCRHLALAANAAEALDAMETWL